MTEQEKKKAIKLLTFAKNPQMAIHDELQEITDLLKVIVEKEMPPYPEMPEFPEVKFPEVQKIVMEGIEVMTLRGERGEKGNQGESGIDGKDGKDGINGKNGLDGINGKDGYTPLKGKDYFDGKHGTEITSEDIVNKLEKLEGDKKLNIKAIGGWEELMKEIRTEMERVQNVLSNIPRGKAMGRAKVPMPRTIDLTADQNGIARVFTLPPDTVRIHGGLSSQFPFAISSSDISRSGNQITLNDTIVPRERGQTLLIFTDALFYP